MSARRNHTVFPIDSMQMNRDIGEVLCERFPEKRVQMKGQDVTVGVEAVEGTAYVYARSVRGIGGLPVGSSGKVVCLLSSGIDSPVATWRMARRGAVPIGVHFSGRPPDFRCLGVPGGRHRARARTHRLHRARLRGALRRLPARDIPLLSAVSAGHPVPAPHVPRGRGAGAAGRGWRAGDRGEPRAGGLADLGQHPRHERRGGTAGAAAAHGSDKLEIIEAAQELGTFEISSMDAPDCCTLFMPRNPETHAKLEAVREAEGGFSG